MQTSLVLLLKSYSAGHYKNVGSIHLCSSVACVIYTQMVLIHRFLFWLNVKDLSTWANVFCSCLWLSPLGKISWNISNSAAAAADDDDVDDDMIKRLALSCRSLLR